MSDLPASIRAPLGQQLESGHPSIHGNNYRAADLLDGLFGRNKPFDQREHQRHLVSGDLQFHANDRTRINDHRSPSTFDNPYNHLEAANRNIRAQSFQQAEREYQLAIDAAKRIDHRAVKEDLNTVREEIANRQQRIQSPLVRPLVDGLSYEQLVAKEAFLQRMYLSPAVTQANLAFACIRSGNPAYVQKGEDLLRRAMSERPEIASDPHFQERKRSAYLAAGLNPGYGPGPIPSAERTSITPPVAAPLNRPGFLPLPGELPAQPAKPPVQPIENPRPAKPPIESPRPEPQPIARPKPEPPFEAPPPAPQPVEKPQPSRPPEAQVKVVDGPEGCKITESVTPQGRGVNAKDAGGKESYTVQFDKQGQLIYVHERDGYYWKSPDAGKTWIAHNAAGKPVDSKGKPVAENEKPFTWTGTITLDENKVLISKAQSGTVYMRFPDGTKLTQYPKHREDPKDEKSAELVLTVKQRSDNSTISDTRNLTSKTGEVTAKDSNDKLTYVVKLNANGKIVSFKEQNSYEWRREPQDGTSWTAYGADGKKVEGLGAWRGEVVINEQDALVLTGANGRRFTREAGGKRTEDKVIVTPQLPNDAGKPNAPAVPAYDGNLMGVAVAPKAQPDSEELKPDDRGVYNPMAPPGLDYTPGKLDSNWFSNHKSANDTWSVKWRTASSVTNPDESVTHRYNGKFSDSYLPGGDHKFTAEEKVSKDGMLLFRHVDYEADSVYNTGINYDGITFRDNTGEARQVENVKSITTQFDNANGIYMTVIATRDKKAFNITHNSVGEVTSWKEVEIKEAAKVSAPPEQFAPGLSASSSTLKPDARGTYKVLAPPGLDWSPGDLNRKSYSLWNHSSGPKSFSVKYRYDTVTNNPDGTVTHRYDGRLGDSNVPLVKSNNDFKADETLDANGKLLRRHVEYQDYSWRTGINYDGIDFKGPKGRAIHIDKVATIDTLFDSSTGKYSTTIKTRDDKEFQIITSGDGTQVEDWKEVSK